MPHITQNDNKVVHICNSKLDAFHLKNAIERVSCICVTIKRVDKSFELSVNASNKNKAIMIVQNSIYNLPSKLAYA